MPATWESSSGWGPNVTLCGETAGLDALGQALDLLELGRAETVLAGGVEAYGETLFEGLRRAGAESPRKRRRSCSSGGTAQARDSNVLISPGPEEARPPAR